MTMMRVSLGEAHGGFDPEWGYAATFDVRDEQEATVVRESWEQNVYRLTPGRFVRPGVVVDLGACFGAFTLLALVLGVEHVVAVEPVDANRKRLLAHVRDWGVTSRLQVLTSAVGLSGAPYRVVGDGVCAHVEWADRGDDVPRRLGLDDLVDEHPAIDVLKVDVEGAEYDLIGDASRDALAAVRFIAMEWHATGLGVPDGDGKIGVLVERLLHTHHVEVSGDPSVGGMLYGTLR